MYKGTIVHCLLNVYIVFDHRRHHTFGLHCCTIHCRLCSSVFFYTNTHRLFYTQIGFQCICTLWLLHKKSSGIKKITNTLTHSLTHSLKSIIIFKVWLKWWLILVIVAFLRWIFLFTICKYAICNNSECFTSTEPDKVNYWCEMAKGCMSV